MTNVPEIDELVGLYQGGTNSDDILKAMHGQGLTITEAIKASLQLFGIGLGDAKSLVSAHPSWSQTVEAARPLHEELIQALQGTNGIGTHPE